LSFLINELIAVVHYNLRCSFQEHSDFTLVLGMSNSCASSLSLGVKGNNLENVIWFFLDFVETINLLVHQEVNQSLLSGVTLCHKVIAFLLNSSWAVEENTLSHETVWLNFIKGSHIVSLVDLVTGIESHYSHLVLGQSASLVCADLIGATHCLRCF
jgi:hypothetical protein